MHEGVASFGVKFAVELKHNGNRTWELLFLNGIKEPIRLRKIWIDDLCASPRSIGSWVEYGLLVMNASFINVKTWSKHFCPITLFTQLSICLSNILMKVCKMPSIFDAKIHNFLSEIFWLGLGLGLAMLMYSSSPKSWELLCLNVVQLNLNNENSWCIPYHQNEYVMLHIPHTTHIPKLTSSSRFIGNWTLKIVILQFRTESSFFPVLPLYQVCFKFHWWTWD